MKTATKTAGPTIAGLCFALVVLPGAGHGQDLTFQGQATLQAEQVTDLGSYVMPTGPYTNQGLPIRVVEGTVSRQAWRLYAEGVSTLALLVPLRDQILAMGYEPILDCETLACGGFDFRFGTDIMAPPDMFVDLGDFRFFGAVRDSEDGDEAITLMVSRSGAAGFVQIIRVGPQARRPIVAAPEPASAAIALPRTMDDFGQVLEARGHLVLSDLTFATGSAQLGEGPYSSLRALADYLTENPDRTVALVGHTDASGSLDANIALSRRRAASVVERLVSEFGVRRAQVEAQGMGYLAPVSSNLTLEGREANRRVEVIVTSTLD